MFKIMIGVVLAAAIIIVGFMLIDPNVSTAQTSQVVEVASDSSAIAVEGEVNKPGTYSFTSTITMADLIEAAGGVTSNADDLAYYEEATLEAGNTYYIASKYDVSDICNNKEIEKVNINSDTADTLVSINGITSSIASSIVSYRTSNGQFKTIEQLTDVYGIGNATYRKIRNYVTLHE